MNFFNQLGHSSQNILLMDLSRSLWTSFVHEEISRLKALITLKHMLLLFIDNSSSSAHP